MSKNKKSKDGKLALVIGTTPASLELIDSRLMKPVCHQAYEAGELTGSMVIQQIDKVSISSKSSITYFVPNNIALLLAASQKASDTAQKIYSQNFANPDIELDLEKMSGDKKASMAKVSKLVCDYLEQIQISIVFGYTALEAFVNLSIPDSYNYHTAKNSKGVGEIYDKTAIERWLPLKTKLGKILPEIYQVKNLESQKWWGNILNLEACRHDIIHQKSISHTDFYKAYFKKNIFTICNSPRTLIRFFHDSLARDNQTNPMWPWMEGTETLPINKSYNSNSFEVVGNLYQGMKK